MSTLTQILCPLRRQSIPVCTSPYLHTPVHIFICLCPLELSRSRHPLHYLEFKTRNRIKRKSDRLNVAHQIPWPVLQPKHVDRQPYICVELHTKLPTATSNALALVHSLRFHTVLKKIFIIRRAYMATVIPARKQPHPSRLCPPALLSILLLYNHDRCTPRHNRHNRHGTTAFIANHNCRSHNLPQYHSSTLL